MSTSPLRQVFETAAPSDLVNIQRPTAGGFSGIDASVPLASLLDSGVYTPTASAETNLTTLSYPSTFIRVGNIVNAFVLINITLDVGEDTGSFELSLPIASNFTNNKQLQGVIQWSKDGNPLAEITAINIISSGSIMQVSITTATTNADLTSCVIAFQYEIV